jgi:hypothetical protein
MTTTPSDDYLLEILQVDGVGAIDVELFEV